MDDLQLGYGGTSHLHETWLVLTFFFGYVVVLGFWRCVCETWKLVRFGYVCQTWICWICCFITRLDEFYVWCLFLLLYVMYIYVCMCLCVNGYIFVCVCVRMDIYLYVCEWIQICMNCERRSEGCEANKQQYFFLLTGNH